jgi:putative ABC transport system substrate-binding protein
MRRREVFVLLSGTLLAALWSRWGAAETTPTILRVGMATIAPRSAPHIIAFVERMAVLGFCEGDKFALEHLPVASIKGYEAAFHELTRRNVDIYVAFGNEVAAAAARTAAQGRPMVLLALTFDPLANGYAASLAHPGGNITGVLNPTAYQNFTRNRRNRQSGNYRLAKEQGMRRLTITGQAT